MTERADLRATARRHMHDPVKLMDRELLMRIAATSDYRSSQRFFEPTREFVSWMRDEYGGGLVYDVGAGDGFTARTLKAAGVRVEAIDLYRHAAPVFPVTISDGATHAYEPGSVVMVCRPCHGAFAEAVACRAMECKAAVVLYVGQMENVSLDLNELAPRFGRVLTSAGKSGEGVWRMKMKNVPKREVKTVKVALLDDEVQGPSWREDGGDRWLNMAGGYRPKHHTDKVLEVVDMVEGEWSSLDWTKTRLLDHKSKYGWIAPDGAWYGCRYEDHDRVCVFILKKEVYDVEKTHVRVGAMGPTGPMQANMTAEQRNVLRQRGFDDYVDENDGNF